MLKDELTILDRDKFIIYTGESHNQIKKYLADRTSSFISTVGPPDIDLTNKEVLLDTVAEARGGRVPQRVKDISRDLDLEDIETIVKTYWVCGKWVGESEKCDISTYNLFVDSVESKIHTLDDYFKLREVYSYTMIRNSFLTFLVKAYTLKGIEGNSAVYQTLCQRAHNKFTPEKIKKQILRLGSDDSELSFIQMMMELQ